MLAIAFDMTVADMERLHPHSVRAAYADIGRIMGKHGYTWIQGSVYMGGNNDLGTLVLLINDLRALPWFPSAVRDIRAFRVRGPRRACSLGWFEQWSDMTRVVKS